MSDVVRNPIYATGVGLLHYGLKMQGEGDMAFGSKKQEEPILAKIKRWFQGNF